MDPILVEPLNSALPAALVPYGTFEDETPTTKGFGEKKRFPLKSQNVKSLNLEDNPIRTMVEMVDNDTEPEVDPLGSRENSPIEKQGSQDPNPDESGVLTNTE